MNQKAKRKRKMPSPKPTNNETKSEYISRCVKFYIDEGREQKQALAICYSLWDKSKKNILEKINQYVDDNYKFDFKLIKESIEKTKNYNPEIFEILAREKYDELNECFNLNISFTQFLNLL